MAEVRTATPADLEAWYGRAPRWSMRAVVLADGDDVLAIGGIAYGDSAATAFMEWRDEAQRYPVALVKAGRRVMREAARRGACAVSAMASEEHETAPRFLETLGFQPAYGRIWQWRS